MEPEAESTSTEDAIGDEDIEVTNEVWAGEENISASISDSARFRATRDMAQMPAHEHLESTNTWKAEEPICYDIPTQLYPYTFTYISLYIYVYIYKEYTLTYDHISPHVCMHDFCRHTYKYIYTCDYAHMLNIWVS